MNEQATSFVFTVEEVKTPKLTKIGLFNRYHFLTLFNSTFTGRKFI